MTSRSSAVIGAAALLLASLTIAGCTEGRSDPPNASLRVVHAAPSLGPVTFRRVRANETPLSYKEGSSFSFDVDTYTFNFEILGIDGSVSQTVSLEHTLEEGSDYTLVLREVGGQPEPRVIEAPSRDGSAAGTQLQLMHAATTVGDVDVFIDLEGFDVNSATPWGTLSYDGVLEPRTFASGSYEIVVTEAGNRANVLLATDPFPLGALQNAFLFIADDAGASLAPYTIAVAETPSRDLVDTNLQSGIRVLNAVIDRNGAYDPDAIDAGIDGELNPPLIQAVPFGALSGLATIASGEHNFNVTPAGNPGVIETDEPFTAAKAALGTWLVTGTPGSVTATLLADEFRVFRGEAKLQIIDGSAQNDAVEVFFVAPGTDLSATEPTAELAVDTATPNIRLAPGDYELTVRSAADQTVLAGPTALSVAAGGYYGILLSDTLSSTGVGVHLLYDFN